MRVHEITWRMRNDYAAILQCEHCEHQQRSGGLYADHYFSTQVIPNNFYCGKCGLNSLGKKCPESETVTA
jgi:transcription elongation factor Elf1